MKHSQQIFRNVANFKYWIRTTANKNFIHENEIYLFLAASHSVQDKLFLISYLKIRKKIT
jgi:hypothetical protein